MDENHKELSEKKLPFENLHLASGLVNGYNKWWMYLYTIALTAFGYFAFQTIISFPLLNRLIERGYTEKEIFKNAILIFDSEALAIDRNYTFLLELGMFVFALVGLYSGIKFVHKKQFVSVLTGYEKFRYKRVFLSFFIWSVFIVLAVIAEKLMNPTNFEFDFNAKGFVFSVLIGIVFIPIQSGCEEIFFRGYLLQGLSQLFKNGWIPVLITSLLFGWVHMGNPEVDEYGWQIMLAYFCCTALFFGILTLLDEGIELAMGVHIANNLISCILVTDKHSVIKSYSILQRDKINPSLELISWLIMATLTFLILKKVYGWKNFKLLIK